MSRSILLIVGNRDRRPVCLSYRRPANGTESEHSTKEQSMDEDALIRQFLKTFGVNAQREIEKAVRDADSEGKLTRPSLPAKAVLTIDGIDLKFEIRRDIALA